MNSQTKKPFIKSMISQRLFGREGIKEYGDAVKNLSEKAKQIDESAVLFVALFEGRERYRELVKAIANILDAEKIFNQRAIERNPEIAKEMAEAYEHLKKFNNIIRKRKKRNAIARQKKNQENSTLSSENSQLSTETDSEQTLNNNSVQENNTTLEVPENQEDF